MVRMVVALLLAGIGSAWAQPAFNASTVGEPRSGRAGELFLPSGSGPFPAMVVLHGSGTESHPPANG